MGFTRLVTYGLGDAGTAPAGQLSTSNPWRHRDTGQRFEMQFHTEIGYHVPR
jgi:hypothetical protein